MKKFCLIGSSFSALPLAERIVKFGHQLYVVGNKKNDPCHNFAHKSIFLDYSNINNTIKIEDINFEVKDLTSHISIIVVNDASSQQIIDKYPNTENINSIEIINMKENRGHSRCIASGLKYIFEKKEFDYVIPMDGDGEDRPEEIKNFIELSKEAGDRSIVGERVKRSEGLFFKFCYQFHKYLTLAFGCPFFCLLYTSPSPRDRH